MASPRRIVLIGGGNGTHVLAAWLGKRRDLRLDIVTRRPESWQPTIECIEEHASSEVTPVFPGRPPEVHVGRPAGVHGWNDAEGILAGADVAILCCPVSAHRDLLTRVLPLLRPGAIVGTLFAQGGFDWLAQDVATRLGIDLDGLALFGLQHFPFLCKIASYGSRVRLFGRFPTIRVATRSARPSDVHAALADLFRRPIVRLPFLSCTLALSNQVLHPAITWALLAGRGPDETVFEDAPFFYPSCDPAAADVMLGLIDDIFLLAAGLRPATGIPVRRTLVGDPGIRIALDIRRNSLQPLERFSPVRRLSTLLVTGLYRINRRLGPARLPVRPDPGGRGVVADVGSRFWEDDIPHGLCVLAGLAEILDVPVPTITGQIEVHQRWMGFRYQIETGGRTRIAGPDLDRTSAPQRFGVDSIEGLRRLVGTGAGLHL